VTVGRVEGDRLDLDEELAWAWLWCGTGLELEGFAFGEGNGGEVGGHAGLLLRWIDKFKSWVLDIVYSGISFRGRPRDIPPSYMLNFPSK
jgi:hypothetical protein